LCATLGINGDVVDYKDLMAINILAWNKIKGETNAKMSEAVGIF
jgi:hypothetical protein